MHNEQPMFPEEVVVTDQEIDLSHVGESARTQYIAEALALHQDWEKSGATRRVVGIAGPSGAGKSVFVAVIKDLLAQIAPSLTVVPLTIDAYHFRNDTLHEKGLAEHKGRYDTYHVAALHHDLSAFKKGESVTFPTYSRKLHEPDQEGEQISAGTPALLLVEGLWLLCQEHGWQEVTPLLDQKLFLEDSPETLRKRTIERHVRGGRSEADAAQFFDSSDSANNTLVLTTQGYATRTISFLA